MRATAAATLAAGTWVNSALTMTQTLPVGTYAVVGLRAIGANLQAARLSFIGGGYRPGVPAVNGDGDGDFKPLRFGMSGEFGRFDNNTIPSVDCLGHTDTSQRFYLDLIKVA